MADVDDNLHDVEARIALDLANLHEQIVKEFDHLAAVIEARFIVITEKLRILRELHTDD